jgi:uncharacterized membrane protein YedE/YeeE
MVAAGWVEAGKSLYGGPRWLWISALAGGVMFGFGMVLASGCGHKNLVRLGGGNLKSLVVLLVVGLAAWMTLRGLTAVWRVATVDALALVLPVSQDLPTLAAQALGLPRGTLALALGAGVGGSCVAWALWRPEGRHPHTLLAGLGVGLIVTGVWWVSGRLGHVAEDPATLEEAFVATHSRRMESLSFVAPLAHGLEWLVMFSDRSLRLTLGIVAVAGVVLGSAGAALASRSFRWEGFRDAGDLGNHLAGGLLMGVGGVTALGCTVGQGISGVSTLSLTSFVALAGILAGAVLALHWQAWRVDRMR